MKKAIFLGVVLATLTAGSCQHTEPAVEIRTVEVPVPTACLTQEQLAEDRFQEPSLVGDRLGRTPETAMQDRDILGASALALRAWGKLLRAAHEGCAAVDPD